MTANSKIQSISPRKAPILEAIFEWRWALTQVPGTQVQRDPSYPLLYGRLYDRFKKDYPLTEDLPSTQVHPDASPYVPRHRLKNNADGCPILQVGPGILSLHQGREYVWEPFRKEIIRVVEAFTDFYPGSTFPLNVLKTELRFVNGMDFHQSSDPIQIFASRFRTDIKLDDALFSPTAVQPKAEAVSLTAGFNIASPIGKAMLAIGSGMADDKPAIIQQMSFQSLLETAPQGVAALDPWLDGMHKIAKTWYSTFFQDSLVSV